MIKDWRLSWTREGGLWILSPLEGLLKALSRVQEGVKGAHKTYGEGAGHTVNVVPDTRLRESGDLWCGARASAEPAPSSGHAAPARGRARAPAGTSLSAPPPGGPPVTS